MSSSIQKANAPSENESSNAGILARLRVIPTCHRESVSDVGTECTKKLLVDDYLVWRYGIATRDELIISLDTGLQSQSRARDDAVSTRKMNRRAEYRADRNEVWINTKLAHQFARVSHRCFSIERKRALWGETKLESAREKQASERLAHTCGHHHHVEQHRCSNGDAEHGEKRSRAVASERCPRESDRHQRPKSTSGGVRTRRSDARIPAAIPSTSESVTASVTIDGVMIENATGVR